VRGQQRRNYSQRRGNKYSLFGAAHEWQLFAFGVRASAGRFAPGRYRAAGQHRLHSLSGQQQSPDGTLAAGVAAAQSEVIEFDLNGNILQTFKVPGHPDGLLAFDANTVWVSSNEDANPVISVIDTASNTVKSLTSDVATLPRGGGLDDMKLANDVVYASASNPTVTTAPVPDMSPYSTDSNGATA
jgi:hypothetical protein